MRWNITSQCHSCEIKHLLGYIACVILESRWVARFVEKSLAIPLVKLHVTQLSWHRPDSELGIGTPNPTEWPRHFWCATTWHSPDGGKCRAKEHVTQCSYDVKKIKLWQILSWKVRRLANFWFFIVGGSSCQNEEAYGNNFNFKPWQFIC